MWIIARIAIFTILVGCTNLFAQAGEAPVAEIGVYGGTLTGPLGGHPAVGAYFGGAFNRHAVALLDVGYMPLGTRSLVRADQPPSLDGVNVLATDTRDSGLYDFSAAVHIRFPIGNKFAPYGILGGALLYTRYQLDTLLSDETVLHSVFTTSRFGFETGGGIRYHFTDKVGLRTEFRETFSTKNFSRFLVGVFYQFEEGEF